MVIELLISVFPGTYAANTRVIKQSSLQKFQEEMDAVKKDPYRVVMRQSKLPTSLLHDRIKAHVCMPINEKCVLKFFKTTIVQSFYYLKAGDAKGTVLVRQCVRRTIRSVNVPNTDTESY